MEKQCFCNMCGKQIMKKTRFCPYCGEKNVFWGNEDNDEIVMEVDTDCIEETTEAYIENGEQNSIVETINPYIENSASDEWGNAIKETMSYVKFRLKLAATGIFIFVTIAIIAGIV